MLTFIDCVMEMKSLSFHVNSCIVMGQLSDDYSKHKTGIFKMDAC